MKDWNAAPILSARNLTRRYGEHIGCRGVSFDLWPGEVLGIVGESGSGKTTLLNILAALDKPTSGVVSLDGQNLSKIKESAVSAFRRDNLGFVFQDFNLLDTFSIEDNIYLPLVLAGEDYREMGQKIRPIAQALHIYELLEKYPYEVSGGQKQRGASARALITNPRIIFADEPTGNLDSLNARELMEYFVKINEEKHTTIIMVTHDSFVASYSKKVYYMKDGHLDLSIDRHTKSQDDYYKDIVKVTTQMHL